MTRHNQQGMFAVGHAGHLVAPATGANHPDTSHEAAKVAGKSYPGRQKMVTEWILFNGNYGATDDEVDVEFGWGHATTSSIMSTLRRNGTIKWTTAKRKTRKGCAARVNVIA